MARGGRYVYTTNCVSSSAKSIDQMVDRAKEVSYRRFIKHCPDAREVLGYKRGSGVTLKDDWAVGFYQSFYRGRPCFYARHSAIEYIWVLTPEENA